MLVLEEDVPGYINEFFKNIGTKLTTSFDSNDQIDEINYNLQEQMEFNPISSNVYNKLMQVNAIDIYKASRIGGISTRLNKDAMRILHKEFLYLFTCRVT